MIAADAPPPPPAAKVETATGGVVTAAFSYTDAGDGKWTGLKVTVTRDGTVAFDAAPTTEDCEEPYCAPYGAYGDRASLHVTDLDADGEPEVVVDLYSGGAHCCVIALVLRWTGTGYATTVRNFADAGYDLSPPLFSGEPANFLTADARFAYTFASYADSVMPVRILTFTGGRWHDITRAHPDVLQSESEGLLKDYNKRRRGTRALGILAAWAADEYRLGRRRQADAFLRAELRAGRLRSDFPWPRRKAYISALQRRLKAWGYAKAG